MGCYIDIKDQVGHLPAGALKVHGFLVNGMRPEHTTKLLHMFGGSYPDRPVQLLPSQFLPMTTDMQTFKYSIQNGCIRFESFQEGKVYVEFDCISTDNEGYPLIPETSVEAVSAYIIHMMETRKFYQDGNRIAQKQNAERDWLIKCTQAYAEEEWPDSIEIRQIEGIWNNMYPLPDIDLI